MTCSGGSKVCIICSGINTIFQVASTQCVCPTGFYLVGPDCYGILKSILLLECDIQCVTCVTSAK